MKYFNINDWVVLDRKDHPWHLKTFQVSEITTTASGTSYVLKFGNRLVLAQSTEVAPMSQLNTLLKRECGKCSHS